jgi:hypothetical protein
MTRFARRDLNEGKLNEGVIVETLVAKEIHRNLKLEI